MLLMRASGAACILLDHMTIFFGLIELSMKLHAESGPYTTDCMDQKPDDL